MDPRLTQAFLADEPPFDGETLTLITYLPPADLLLALRGVSSWLDNIYQGPLWQCDDWHYHDGYVTPSSETSRAEIAAWLADDNSMVAALSTDTLVAKAIYSDDLRILWRTTAKANHPNAWTGAVDVTAPPELLDALHLTRAVERVPATRFFFPGHTGPAWS